MYNWIMNNKIKLLGVKISTQSNNEVLLQIKKILNSDSKHYITTPNPEFLLIAEQDNVFKKILNQSDINIPDGIGILWAAKFLSLKSSKNIILRILQLISQYFYTLAAIIFHPKYIRTIIPARITGSDLTWEILKLAEKKNKAVYLLGSKQGIAKESAQIIKNKYPNIRIAGAQSGGFPIVSNNQNIIDDINRVKPDIIFVALGAPKQEKWIRNNLPKLKSIKLAIGVGGALDFISGNIERAPKIFINLGLEWIYRLYKEPKRIIRIYHATIKFPFIIFKYKLINKT